MESFFAITKSLIIRALIIYFISSFFRRPQADTTAQAASGPRIQATNIFENGTLFDLNVYLSEAETFKEFDDPQALIWSEHGLVYGDWYSGPDGDGSKVLQYKFKPSERLKNNGSIYLHIYVTKTGKSPNPKAGKGLYGGDNVSYTKRMINKFKKIRYQKKHNLLTGETTASEEEKKKAEIMDQEYVSHWHPNLTINLVTDQTNWVYGQVPPPLDECKITKMWI